jgi:ATP-dependent Clp protease ATP-binding subunit ClpA
MFERFTERARQVVVLAQEEARTLKHNYIGTEHILLGLLREQEGLAGRVLEQLGITVEGVRAQVLRVVSAGEEAVSGQIPFTPRAKKSLELALREALGLGHNYIGTEHILLGLVRENDGVAARILLDFDADSETIRNEVIHMLAAAPSAQAPPVVHWDSSAFDFTAAETSDLATRLAPLTSEIALEVRHHGDQPPTFRVSCRPLEADGTLRGLVALESAGIGAVLDGGTRVRLRHLGESTGATPGEAVGEQ